MRRLSGAVWVKMSWGEDAPWVFGAAPPDPLMRHCALVCVDQLAPATACIDACYSNGRQDGVTGELPVLPRAAEVPRECEWRAGLSEAECPAAGCRWYTAPGSAAGTCLRLPSPDGPGGCAARDDASCRASSVCYWNGEACRARPVDAARVDWNTYSRCVGQCLVSGSPVDCETRCAFDPDAQYRPTAFSKCTAELLTDPTRPKDIQQTWSDCAAREGGAVD
jgi:hypothetical protein